MITLPYKPEVQRITQADKIISLGCEYFDVTYEALKSSNKKRPLVDARHMLMTLISHTTGEYYDIIGSRFNRNRTSVNHAVNTVKHRRKEMEAYNETYVGLKDYVTGNLEKL